MIRLIVVAAAAIGLILFAAFVISRLLETRTRGMSIRMQVFLALAAIVGAFAFGLGVMVIDRIEARAVRLATQAATDEAAAIAGLLAGEMQRTGTGIDKVAERMGQEQARGADLRLELLDADSRVIFPPGSESSKGEPGTVSVDAPILHDGAVVGAVRVVKPTVVMRRLLADFAPTVLVISLVLGAAAAIAAAAIGRSIARPLERLSGFAESVSAGERTAAPPATWGREVTHLSRSIDSMRRQLEGRPFVEAFAADLSHELKNPVAAIRASAEVLEESALDEPEEARRFLSRIRESTERIERLLGDLLSLARIEARGIEDLTQVDLGQLARRIAEQLDAGGERLELTSTGDTRVRGDEAWLARALSNLIQNALIHGQDGERVQVKIERTPDGVSASVQSSGAVPKHVRKNLFRRFVTTRSDKGGTGLGLAIVRAVAESHGGQARLPEPGPPTVRFELVLPPAVTGAREQLLKRAGDRSESRPSNPAISSS
ncbi:MAG: histidine kinase dimerization/phospho-acceptor domain-containing protein [Polyangiaceae bacterium]